MRIVLGLGNPGPKYRNTRHNVGFCVLDALSVKLNAPFSREKYDSEVASAVFESEKLLLMKPLTYMNRSGNAAARAARNNLGSPAGLLVVVDDVNLPLGRMRFRAQGSAGGHNGLRSIIERLGTDEFPRLRLGVGAAAGEGGLVDHVLGRFRPAERGAVDDMIARAVDGVICFLTRAIEEAMDRYNRAAPGK